VSVQFRDTFPLFPAGKTVEPLAGLQMMVNRKITEFLEFNVVLRACIVPLGLSTGWLGDVTAKQSF